MDTYMRGMGGCRLGRMATCMAACSAKAAVEYCVRNVLCISGFAPTLAYAKAAKSRINHALSSIKKTKRMLFITASVGHIVPDRRCCI